MYPFHIAPYNSYVVYKATRQGQRCVAFMDFIVSVVREWTRREVGEVVESGPSLAFLVYPEVVLSIAPSPLWAFLFFAMLLNLGLDTQFSSVESLVTMLSVSGFA